MSILEGKLKEHVQLHHQSEQKLQDEINDMTNELEKVKDLLEEKLDSLGPDELPTDVLHGESRSNRASSLHVEVGDLETFNDNDDDQ